MPLATHADPSLVGWAVFAVVMLLLIAVDLFAHRRGHGTDSPRRALLWSIGWIAAAMAFNVYVVIAYGLRAGEEFLTAYILEKSLSVDNLFVFLLLFQALKIPPELERRVLSWGVFGALVTRGIFIAVGGALIARWHATLYVFGALLLFTAIKMLLSKPDTEEEPPGGAVIAKLRRWLPFTADMHGGRFWARESGRFVLTPMLLALVAIEFTDVIFALDSIPAAFAVSDAPFIIYSSNVFAVMGLRSLFIVLAGALASLRYLRYALAAILAIAGAKMLLIDVVHLPTVVSLGLIVACLAAAVVASLLRPAPAALDAPTGERAKSH